jgi:hypothetical protein
LASASRVSGGGGGGACAQPASANSETMATLPAQQLNVSFFI